MQFEYLQRLVVDADIDIPDVGNCVLQSRNDIGEEFYLVIKTTMGWTEVYQYGPAVPDLPLLPTRLSINYDRFEYNQAKICRIIDKFLNDAYKSITQASLVELADIKQFIRNPLDSFERSE